MCRVDVPGSDPAMFGIGTGLGAGKRSIALDARHPRRAEVLRKLCEWTDVVVDNSRPGDLEERGFGYRQASEEHPGLVWCSITGFGQDGPYALWPGHDLTYTAHSGLLGSLDSEMPWHPQMMLSVPIGATMAVVGIVSALYARDATGMGRQLDISLSESATWVLSGFDALINDTGFSIPTSPDRRLYLCGDGRYVSVAAADPRTWDALCTGLGLLDLAKRRVPADEWPKTTERLAGVFMQRSAAEWVADLGPRGAAIGPVNVGPDLLADPQVTARRSLEDVDGVVVPANPIRTVPVSEGDGQAHGGVPNVGEHTRLVLLEAGFSSAEVDRLVDDGVVGE